MPRLNFDVDVHDAIRNAPSDPKAARALLLSAAKYLRDRIELPDLLADWVADAFEAAGHKSEKKAVVRALTEALCLTAANRRPGADWLSIGQRLHQLVEQEGTLEKAIAALDKEFPKRLHRDTLSDYLKRYREARELHEK